MLDKSFSPFAVQRLVATPPEIYRSEMTDGKFYGGFVRGNRFRLRSDFPVYLTFDGQPIGPMGKPIFPPWHTFTLPGEPNKVRRVNFRLPVGFGGSGNDAAPGALTQSQLLSRHGTCVLEAVDDGVAEPVELNPDRMPVRTMTVDTADIAVNAAGGLTWTPAHTIDRATWSARHNGYLPDDIWVKSFSLFIFSGGASTIPAPVGEFVTMIEMFKVNSPVGDDNNGLIWACFDKPYQTHQVNNMKLPLRSLYAPYAAETPSLTTVMAGTVHNTVILRVRLLITYAYEMGLGL